MYTYISGYKPENYQCLLPNCNGNTSSYIAEQNYVYLHNATTLNRNPDVNVNRCHIKPTTDWANKQVENCNKIEFDRTGEYIICDPQSFDIVYDNFTMNSTIVTEFKLFCNEEYKVIHVILYRQKLKVRR